METLEAIRKRCSLKARLSPRAIEPEKLWAVLDAARLAPSARNTQPWRFVVVQGAAVEPLVDATFSEANTIAKRAPVIIVACANPEDDVTREGKAYYLYDVGSAVQNLLLAATDHGLVTHLIASFDEAEMKRLLHIPDDVRVVVVTPLAYPDAPSYDEAAAERLTQRSRLAREAVVFAGAWGRRLCTDADAPPLEDDA